MLAGALMGMGDLTAFLTLGLEMRWNGRSVMTEVMITFMITYGVLGFVIGKLIEARAKAREDAKTIASQLRALEASQRAVLQNEKLAAIGRLPNTEALNLEAAGIRSDKNGYVQVNERLETNVPGVYALGDVKGGPAFTHVSYDDFRILRTNLLDHGSASTQHRLVPHAIFIDPQLGRVGLTENEARKQGRNIRVAKLPMNSVVRALETGETRGFMKAVVDADTQHILGCAILGVEGGEIMTIIQVAMIGKLPYTALKEGTFTHPTLAEGLNTLFMTLDS